MTPEALIAVSAAVVALTQLAKWSGLPDKYGPIAVLAFALLGVLFWGWSNAALSRALAWNFFAGWIVVATSASGVYGFSRAAVAASVTTIGAPPAGGGAEPTEKR